MPPKIENPVNNPNVPPIPDNMVANFAALSLVILSNVGVSKKIFTNLILLFHSKSRIDNFMENFDQISTEQMLQIKLTFQSSW